MENNSKNTFELDSNLDNLEKNESNNFQKNLSELSKDIINNFTINNNQEENLSLSSTDINLFCEQLKDNKSPYLNNDEIQELKILDENHLESGEKIEIYLSHLKSNSDIDVEKYSKCNICQVNDNKFFCSICRRNFCINCCKFCKKRKHILTDLNDKKTEADYYKKYIKLFISKYFIQISNIEKKEEGTIKNDKNYIIFDKNEIKEEIGENLKNYTNDILLIETIINKNYKNYFHYRNIEECYAYMKKKFELFLNIEDSVNSEDEDSQKSEKEKELQENMEKEQKEEDLIKKFNESLINDISNGIKEIQIQLTNEEKDWLDSLKEGENQIKINDLKNKIEILFENLFESEEIFKKINNQITKVIKTSKFYDQYEKINFIVMGYSGTGKSTLINELIGTIEAKEGTEKKTTTSNQEYKSEIFPFFTILDTIGEEFISSEQLLGVHSNNIFDYIEQKLKSKNPNENLHCLLYCISDQIFQIDRLKTIINLRKKYGKRLPIIIVKTMTKNKEENKDIEELIIKYILNNGECLNDDIDGINLIKINAREQTIVISNEKIPCFGLYDLVSSCFKKGENAYKTTWRKSLVEQGKDSILNYSKDIFTQISENKDYLEFLKNEFEPNFYDYIAYYFEKITDIDNQSRILDNDKLKNYINNKYLEQGKAIEKEMINLKCDKQIESKEENENNLINKLEKYNIHILNNNLNIYSRNILVGYIKEFKTVFIDIADKKLETKGDFLYKNILEKYIDIINNNISIKNLNKRLKSKDEIKEEIKKKLNQLKMSLTQNILRIGARNFFNYINEIFKDKFKTQLDKFIEVKNYFGSFDILNDKKELKIKKQINKYIKSIRKREEESEFKILKEQFGDQSDLYDTFKNNNNKV